MDRVGERFPVEQEWSARVGIDISSTSSVDPRMRHPPPEPEAVNTPWPGPDFKLETVIPDSVYLWACGEPLQADGISRVSRPQAAAAWIIIISQAVCYAGLWYVAGRQPSNDSQASAGRDSSYETVGYYSITINSTTESSSEATSDYSYSTTDSTNESSSEPLADYSIVAIAGAMYLILSMGAADVWSSCALIVEGRGPAFVLFTRRRLFGVFLLATFSALIGASIRVLFFSSGNNVQLVIGAAAVLFIADVDEKAMLVLKNISGDWVLFWVVEFIGLSFGLALFAVKVTGNTGTISDRDKDNRCTPWTEGGCDIFTWSFVLTAHPTTVTVFAFLLTSVISRTTSSFAGRVVFPRSGKWLVVTLFLLCWLAQGSLWLVHWETSKWFDVSSGGCALVFVIIFYRSELTWINCSRVLRTGVTQGGYRLLSFGGLLIFLGLVLDIANVAISDSAIVAFYPTFYDCNYVLKIAFAAMYFIVYVWLINGLRVANLRSPNLDGNVALLPLLRSIILGWGLSEGYFALRHWVFLHAWKITDTYPNSYPGLVLAEDVFWLVWHFMVGTVLWGERGRAHTVAYWTAATLIRTVVVGCASTWFNAAMDKTAT